MAWRFIEFVVQTALAQCRTIAVSPDALLPKLLSGELTTEGQDNISP